MTLLRRAIDIVREIVDGSLSPRAGRGSG